MIFKLVVGDPMILNGDLLELLDFEDEMKKSMKGYIFSITGGGASTDI